MLLVFYGTRSDRHIAEQIGQIAVIGGVEHFLRAGKAGFADDPHMQLTDGYDAVGQILFLFRVGLMKHPFVACTAGARLVGVNTGNDQQTVFDLLVHAGQAVHVFHHGVLPVRGARADQQQQTVILSRKDIGDLPIPPVLDGPDARIGRELFFQFLRSRHFT